METLCNPITGECRVPYDFSPEEKPLLEDKIVSVLGCILSLLNKGRKEILSVRATSISSFSLDDVGVAEDTLLALAVFRGEMKRCCESLHIALENYVTPDDEISGIVWRKLQKLKNVCYDAGFPRSNIVTSSSVGEELFYRAAFQSALADIFLGKQMKKIYSPLLEGRGLLGLYLGFGSVLLEGRGLR
ncbi:hypothetical protein Bca4012_064594 [Brassica carinata]